MNRKSTEKRTVALTTDFTTLRNLRFYLGASFAVLLIFRRLEKTPDINVRRMKNVHSKMHKKTQRSTGKTSRYIEFDIGALFMVLLIIRQLEKIEDFIVKRTNKIDWEKH